MRYPFLSFTFVKMSEKLVAPTCLLLLYHVYGTESYPIHPNHCQIAWYFEL